MVVACLAACGAPETLPATGTRNGPTLLTAACEGDESCPAGMVCEGCNGPHDAQCIPGCRSDAQCPRLHVCRGPVTCISCPCAPGWCELDPCRDVDGDGYAFTTDPGLSCPGKQIGDCNDGNKNQNPGALELCANGIDDDCDGKTDRFDPSCQRCTAESLVCNDASECGAGTRVGAVQCTSGCCQSCPAVTQPSCVSGELSIGGGLDAVTSCRVARVCVPSATCQGLPFQSLCGADFATYRNPCQLAQAGVAALHPGSCAPNEGRPCALSEPGATGGCDPGQYCRLDAVAGKRCTRLGACLVDADCPAGVATWTACGADGGAPSFTCQQNQCVPRCP